MTREERLARLLVQLANYIFCTDCSNGAEYQRLQGECIKEFPDLFAAKVRT